MANIKDTLLISPDAVKASSHINYNVSDASVTGAIVTSQDVYLREIIGDMLLHRLKELVYNAIQNLPDTIDDDENVAYSTLLDDYIVPFLSMKTQVEILVPISFDIRNIGAGAGKNDTNLTQTSISNLNYMRSTYETQACDKANRLIDFLVANKDAFEELREMSLCDCRRPGLEKQVNTGLWLGGR